MSKPEHIEQLEGGGTVCRHCGGSVDGDGYAVGGEVTELDATQTGQTDEAPQQGESTPGLDHSPFADAVKRRGG